VVHNSMPLGWWATDPSSLFSYQFALSSVDAVPPLKVQVDKAYTTAESYVILAADGERSIIMATGATSLITDEVVRKHFSESVGQCRILSTEISQVPLSGVIELLRAAKAGTPILSVLDVDVQPSVAVEQALLGSLNEVTECVMLADVLKPAKHAAQELLAHLDPSVRTAAFDMSSQDLTARLRDLTGSQLVALTNGAEGCVLATEDTLLVVPPFQLDRVIDATGAGDAFLGGLLAGLYHENGVPTEEAELYSLGELANATGAANCQVLGALPDGESTDHVRGYLQVTENKFLEKLSAGKLFTHLPSLSRPPPPPSLFTHHILPAGLVCSRAHAFTHGVAR
jgi:sugar/nucleoside kinase (ribokinase family)